MRLFTRLFILPQTSLERHTVMNEKLESWFAQMPVVAILRGVRPEQVVAIGEALYKAGIGIIEVPLNSPEPMESIKSLADALGDRCVIGAGTVLTEADAEGVAAAGGQIAVSPNTDPAVITRSLALGMVPMPGWATVTEALIAYQAGARYLKLFPAATYGPEHVKGASAVLPTDCKVLAVGGVGANSAAAWLSAGVDGFGIGSELYKPGDSAEQVHQRAVAVVAAFKTAREG
jgi:2-dehydro-3-deoxyphosphogalactonate aldolase